MSSISRYGKYIFIPLLLLFVVGLALLGTNRLATRAAGTVTCGAWSTIASNNATSTTDNVLSAVAVVSSKNVWAVGYYVDANTGLKQALTEEWNGTGWTVFPGATLTIANVLTGLVVIPNTTRLWAVGYTTDPVSGLSQTLTEQWNGTAWSVIASPNPGAANNVLTSISAHAANKIWVAGYFTNSSTGFDHTLTARWLGGSWQAVTSPNGDVGNSIFYSIQNDPGLDQMWAVGSDIRKGAPHTLIEHWDGRAWAIIASPSPAATSVALTGIAALSLTSVWVVGYYVDPVSGLSQTLTEHWDGTVWTTIPSLNPGTGNNAFYAADRVPTITKIWAVGSNNATSASQQTLTESYC